MNQQDKNIYFGGRVACSRPGIEANTDTFYSKYALSKRPYLGPTSTDHELALLMVN